MEPGSKGSADRSYDSLGLGLGPRALIKMLLSEDMEHERKEGRESREGKAGGRTYMVGFISSVFCPTAVVISLSFNLDRHETGYLIWERRDTPFICTCDSHIFSWIRR